MSGLGRLKAAATCGAGVSFDAAEVDELAELITEHDGVECTKHDVLVKSAVMRSQELEAQLVGARAVADELDSLIVWTAKLKKAAEKVYQLRAEAPAGDNFVEFYNALIMLGHALKTNE